MGTKLFVKATMEVVEKYGDDSSLMQIFCRNAVYTSAEIQSTLLCTSWVRWLEGRYAQR